MASANLSARSASERSLIALLQLAYSGERAAAFAYRGHWKSVSDSAERERIQCIEEEEWHHRRQVLDLLHQLGGAPSQAREFRAGLVGRTLGVLCHLGGWLAPMYGAGKLESRNVREYEEAARLALACGREAWLDCLLTMAEVEWDHERYFRERVLSHWLGRRLPIWPALAPRVSIRANFRLDASSAAGA